MAFGDVIGEAFVRVRPEMSGFRGDVQRNARSSLRGVGGIIGATLGLGVGFGIERELEKTIDKAKEAQVVQAQLRAAITATGQSYNDLAGTIEENIQAQSRLSSFEDEELFQSFTAIVRRVHDVDEALRLNALAANVARGRNISLNTAALLITRAYNGQTQSLRRLGIEVTKTTTVKEALALLDQKYGGAAAAFADTAAGKQERLNKVLDDSREIIGGALLPVISDLTTRFANYIEKQNESGDLQRKVNTIIGQTSSIVHTLGTDLQIVQRVLNPLISAVGGLGNALNIALGIKLVTMLRTAGANFGLLGASVATTTTEGVAEARTFGVAWDTATRPRTMVVTTVAAGSGAAGAGAAGGAAGGAAAGAAGGAAAGAATSGGVRAFLRRTGRRARGLTRRSIVSEIERYGAQTAGAARGSALAIGGGAGIVLGALPFAQAGETRNATPAWNSRTNQWFFVSPFTGSLDEVDERFIRREFPAFYNKVQQRIAAAKARQFRAPAPPPGPDEGTRGKGAPGAPKAKKTSTGRTGGMTTLQRLRLNLAAAERRSDLGAEKRIQGQIVGIYQARVDNTKLTGQALVRFKQELSAEQDKADAIQDSIDAQAKANADKAASKREQAIQAAAAKRDKRDADLLKKLSRGRTPFLRAVQRAEDTEGQKDNIATAKALRDRIQHEIDVVRTSVKNAQTKSDELARLGDDYANAISALNQAKKKRTDALDKLTPEGETRTDALDKIVQIAELTDDPAALDRALGAAIANAKRVLKKAQASGKGVLDAILKLEQLKKQRRDALKQATSSGNRGTTAFDLLQGFAEKFSGGNLINADQPFVGPSGFVADIAQYLKRQPGAKYPSSTSTSAMAGTKTSAETAIDRLIAALDRNTNATTKAPTKVTAPKIDPSKVVSRGGGRYYEAARARNNVETRGGV